MSKLIQKDLNTLAKITQLVICRAKSEAQVYLTPILALLWPMPSPYILKGFCKAHEEYLAL